ncbi:hypothetical protein [Nonomuraea dietziae]|uniref:hypothetical protein n=1 Tax=Nonomuraea dietziae TaxID=65515 RepID=UPI0031D38484
MNAVPRRLSSLLAISLATLLAGSGMASAQTPARTPATAGGWTATWTASPQRPGTNFTPNWSEQGFTNQTIRQVVRISAGGARARIRLSNAYGTAPLKVSGATVARTASGAAVQPASLRQLTVKRARAFTIPAGAELATDPVTLGLSDLDSVTVTLYLAAPTGPATYHAQAMATSYRAPRATTAPTAAPAPSTRPHCPGTT